MLLFEHGLEVITLHACPDTQDKFGVNCKGVFGTPTIHVSLPYENTGGLR